MIKQRIFRLSQEVSKVATLIRAIPQKWHRTNDYLEAPERLSRILPTDTGFAISSETGLQVAGRSAINLSEVGCAEGLVGEAPDYFGLVVEHKPPSFFLMNDVARDQITGDILKGLLIGFLEQGYEGWLNFTLLRTVTCDIKIGECIPDYSPVSKLAPGWFLFLEWNPEYYAEEIFTSVLLAARKLNLEEVSSRSVTVRT